MATESPYDSFKLITGVGISPNSLSALPVQPSALSLEHEDLSDKDAGRTEDGVMHKNYIGTIVGIQLEFKGLRGGVASTLLQLFKYEYVYVRFYDIKINNYETRQFYVGNIKSTAYNAELDLWEKISFNLIERTPVTYVS